MKTQTQTETQTKHTPGPWYATTCGTDIHVQSASINEDNYVCKVYGTLNDDANAALIAAAPALLEALREIKSLSESSIGNGFRTDPAVFRDIAGNAIAAAENLPTG